MVRRFLVKEAKYLRTRKKNCFSSWLATKSIIVCALFYYLPFVPASVLTDLHGANFFVGLNNCIQVLVTVRRLYLMQFMRNTKKIVHLFHQTLNHTMCRQLNKSACTTLGSNQGEGSDIHSGIPAPLRILSNLWGQGRGFLVVVI